MFHCCLRTHEESLSLSLSLLKIWQLAISTDLVRPRHHDLTPFRQLLELERCSEMFVLASQSPALSHKVVKTCLLVPDFWEILRFLSRSFNKMYQLSLVVNEIDSGECIEHFRR